MMMRSQPLKSALNALSGLPETERMPAVFVGHGSPMNSVMESEFTENWVRIGAALPRPKAILMVSAHWLTRGGYLVTGSDQPEMNYDMYGFPPEVYQVKYPAPGDPSLAGAVSEAIGSHTRVGTDMEWGYDHGTWLPMMYMFPDADVPLIQLSMDYSEPPEFQYELAGSLTGLREKGIMLIGSGNLVHNLRLRGPEGSPPPDWAEEFDRKVTHYIEEGDYKSVVNFLDFGTLTTAAHPTYEHFLPLLYVLGVQLEGETVSVFNEGFQQQSVSMKSFVIS